MHNIEEQLLIEYEKFCNASLDNKTPLLKILVGYIKPAFLFKSDILTPIHLGRAVAKENSKDGIISDEDYEWLISNCIGDDDFEGNISNVNRRVGFLTGTYWAWKNYEKLGNPEYFGLFGYRKLLSPDFLSILENYDVILPEKYVHDGSQTIKKHLVMVNGQKIYNQTIKAFENIYPEEVTNLEEYLNQKIGYYHELYIFRRKIFFEYCSWIFPILFELLKFTTDELLEGSSGDNTKTHLTMLSYIKETRDIAFVIERLTGYFCYKLTQNSELKYKECPFVYIDQKEQRLKMRNQVVKMLHSSIKKDMETTSQTK